MWFLVSMEVIKVLFILVLNKCELLSEVEVVDWCVWLESWGYDVKVIFVVTG